MTTVSFAQPLPIDPDLLDGDWLQALMDIASAFSVETISSSRIVIVAGPTTPFPGFKLVILPKTSFGITFSAPYFTGAVGGLEVLDAHGATVVSIADLPTAADFDALVDLVDSLGATIHGSTGADTLAGTAGHDLIEGGAGDDRLNGGAGTGLDAIFGDAGSDTLDGGAGEDFLRGGDGNDVLSGGDAFDDVHGNAGSDTVSGGGGGDWVVGGKDDDRLFGDAGGDVVLGNLGADTCEGGDGADVVRGGQGDDVVRGGAGNDWLSGDRGTDTITGGAGADIFHTFDGAGSDRATDFNAAEDDRVYLLPGTQYAVAQVGADTVVTVTGAEGGTLTLVGVQMSTLQPGWIFGA